MFFVLGDKHDPWCSAVSNEFAGRNLPSRIFPNILSEPSLFRWRFDRDCGSSRVAVDGEIFESSEIEGVFVRGSGWIEPAGWDPEDHAYMQSETTSALFAWLWSLDCPVVNRYLSAIWYHPHKPLLMWYSQLRRCGLPTAKTILTNVSESVGEFGKVGPSNASRSVIYGPLTSDLRYIVGDGEWNRLNDLKQLAPLNLSYPHGAVTLACVVGGRVIWDGRPTKTVAGYEASILRLAQDAGLSFLEIVFAPIGNRPAVISVEPYPRFEHFSEEARSKIVPAIVDVLSSGLRVRAARSTSI